MMDLFTILYSLGLSIIAIVLIKTQKEKKK
jgi:hypothetical protein